MNNMKELEEIKNEFEKLTNFLDEKIGTLEKVKQSFEEKEPFEFGRWYKTDSGVLAFISSINSGYGFNSLGEWMPEDGGEWGLEHFKPASDQEVEERLLQYAKEHYHVGDEYYNFIGHKRYIAFVQFTINRTFGNLVVLESGNCIYSNGKWAEIIEETDKEYDVKTKAIMTQVEFLLDSLEENERIEVLKKYR